VTEKGEISFSESIAAEKPAKKKTASKATKKASKK
jgi:hypothetical protein